MPLWGKIPHKKKGLATGAMILAVFAYSQRSITNLNEVREPLQIVTLCAAQQLKPPLGMIIVDGGRTLEEHKINVANGKSWIKRSRHQDAAAIDFAATLNGVYIKGNTPEEFVYYEQIARAFKKCAVEHNTPIIWGGDWKVRDGLHIELDKRYYP